jgi:hypothetical protein
MLLTVVQYKKHEIRAGEQNQNILTYRTEPWKARIVATAIAAMQTLR